MVKALLAIATDIAAAAAGIILMAASAWLITSASFHPPLSALAVGITLVRAAGILKAVFRYLDRYLSHDVMFKALTQIQLQLYKQALKVFPLKSGAILEAQILHDLAVWADIAKERFARITQPLISTILITAVVTAYLYSIIDVRCLLLPLAMLLTITITYICSGSAQVNDTAYREQLMDFYDGFEELKAFKSSDVAVNKLDDTVAEFSLNEQTKRFNIIKIDTVCAVVNTALMILILRELTGQVDLIGLSMWLFILLMTFEMFTTLPRAVRELNNSECEIRYAELINNPKPSTDDLPLNQHRLITDDYILAIKDLSFAYSTGCKVLDKLSLEVKHGEKIAIIGESGSGKTTLLYLLLGLWSPDSGQIFVNGSIAAATVNNYIFSKSVRENFMILHPNITEESMLRVLRICQLDKLELDRELGENGCKISGGERNRLQTALALASENDILILDEPTAGLDKSTAANLINSIVNEINIKDRTLIVITHDLDVANTMDTVYELFQGKIIYGGSVER